MERFKLISAVHLFLIKDGKILLLRRFNTGYEDGNYSVPAGHLDGNEVVTEAMIREALEEACVQIKPEDLKVIHVMHRKKSDREGIDFFLTAKVWEGNIKIGEPNKCDDLSWFPLDDLPKNTVPYVRFAIQNYRDNIFYSEMGW
jgi:8-oxo-dGTP diphosphatase